MRLSHSEAAMDMKRALVKWMPERVEVVNKERTDHAIWGSHLGSDQLPKLTVLWLVAWRIHDDQIGKRAV